MAKLLEKYRAKHIKQQQANENEKTTNCMELKRRLEYIVNNQTEPHGYIYKSWFSSSANCYNANCKELRDYVNLVNSKPENKIKIVIEDGYVDWIHTNVDWKKDDMVTYTLKGVYKYGA